MGTNQAIDACLELARVAIRKAFTVADTQSPDGERLDPDDEELLSQALTLISRVQRRRS